MPANPKYLTTSKWQRFAKISAAILGGYLVSVLIHLALAAWLDRATVLITGSYTLFLLWTALMVLSFLAKNGWKLWGLYLIIILICGIAIYIGQSLYPLTT